MTKEEAVICLKGIKNYGRDTFTEQLDWQNSLDMAIKALEQQPSDDCVSRAEARQLIAETFRKKLLGITFNKMFETLYKGIDELPPVTPTHKVGEWKKNEDTFWTCSECGFVNKYNRIQYTYCPNCKSLMSKEV